jgi:hypothetical protein
MDADKILAEFDPNKLATEMEQLGVEWSNRDETAGLLEETKKTLLAQIIMEYQTRATETPKKSMPMNQAETMALADPRYRAHIENMVRARSEANRAKVRYDTCKYKVDSLRTLAVTHREAMRMSGIRT